MKIINASQYRNRTGKHTDVAILSLRHNGIYLNNTAIEQANIIKVNDEFYATFAQDENEQLHIKFHKTNEEGSCLFKQATAKKEYICYNQGLSKHFKTLTGSDKGSVPCKIQIQAQTDDGWFPVITTYWKTLN